MARKTKEELNKLDKKIVDESTTKKTTTAKKTKAVAKSKSAVKSAVKKVATTSRKKSTKKDLSKETKNIELKPKSIAKKAKTSNKTSTIAKKETTAKKDSTTSKKKTTAKKASATSKKKTTTKKAPANTKKETTATKSSTTKKKATTKRTSTTRKKATTKKSVKDSNVISLNPIEYYDLPYRYNETVVKVLAQNPNTLFVYWDISDNDRENLEKQYGKLFFYNTRPVLVIHNLTDNYTFEIDIDDFANNWYVNVNDTKCKYFVELGRRPKYENHDTISVNYLKVASSNTIEMPNDHILFFKDNDKIYFKNIKTNRVTEKIFKSKAYSSKLKGIYSNYNLSEKDDRFDFKNPSSQNPTSNVL